MSQGLWFELANGTKAFRETPQGGAVEQELESFVAGTREFEKDWIRVEGGRYIHRATIVAVEVGEDPQPWAPL